MEAGDSPDFNAELTSWLHSFTPAINHYLRTELNYKTDVKYNMFGPGVILADRYEKAEGGEIGVMKRRAPGDPDGQARRDSRLVVPNDYGPDTCGATGLRKAMDERRG